MNDFSNKCRILGELWMEYRDDEQFIDFIEYNDMGLPLAYFISEGLVKPTKEAEIFVEETYELFITSLQIEDGDYADLGEVLEISNELD